MIDQAIKRDRYKDKKMKHTTVRKNNIYLKEGIYKNDFGRDIDVYVVGDYKPLIDSEGNIIKRSLVRLISASPQYNFAVPNKQLTIKEDYSEKVGV